MKRTGVKILALVLCCVLITGCAGNGHMGTPTTTYPPVNFGYIYVDTFESLPSIFGYLVYEADHALIGTVTDVNFEACATVAGYELRSLYTIKVSRCFKGSESEEVVLCMAGGNPDYKLAEQEKLAWEYGITSAKSIYGCMEVELGETYAFLLCDEENGRMMPVDYRCFAFDVNDTRSAEKTDEFCYEDFKNHFKIRD